MKYLAILFMLTGCSEILAPFEVLVPVSVACVVDVPDEPAWPTKSLAKDAGFFERAKTVLAEIELRKSYEEKLRAALKSC